MRDSLRAKREPGAAVNSPDLRWVRFRLDVARLLAHGCVMAVATSTLDAPHGPLRGVNHSRITMLIAAQDGNLGITAFHNTLVTEGG